MPKKSDQTLTDTEVVSRTILGSTPKGKGLKNMVVGRMSSTEPNFKEELKKLKQGFYVLFTGPKVKPLERPFKVGVHGTGRGRLFRGAKWAMRQIGWEYLDGNGVPSEEVTRKDYYDAVYKAGFRKVEVLERVPGREEPRKTGVRFELKEVVS